MSSIRLCESGMLRNFTLFFYLLMLLFAVDVACASVAASVANVAAVGSLLVQVPDLLLRSSFQPRNMSKTTADGGGGWLQ